MSDLLRLTIETAETPGKFVASLDGAFVCQSKTPLLDGARELLKRGVSPDALLTMRHSGADHDSFVPQPVAEWAKWAVSETERDGLRRYRWAPRPEGGFLPTGEPKSESP